MLLCLPLLEGPLLPQRLLDGGEILSRVLCLLVVWPKRSFESLECLLHQSLRLAQSAEAMKHKGEVVHSRESLRVIRAESGLERLQSPPAQSLSIVQAALVF